MHVGLDKFKLFSKRFLLKSAVNVHETNISMLPSRPAQVATLNHAYQTGKAHLKRHTSPADAPPRWQTPAYSVVSRCLAAESFR